MVILSCCAKEVQNLQLECKLCLANAVNLQQSKASAGAIDDSVVEYVCTPVLRIEGMKTSAIDFPGEMISKCQQPGTQNSIVVRIETREGN
jgi:hypothetical protein